MTHDINSNHARAHSHTLTFSNGKTRTLTFRKDKSRWVSWAKDLKRTPYYGTSDDLQEAIDHIIDHEETGVYLKPADFASKQLRQDQDPNVEQPSDEFLTNGELSTIELAKRWPTMSSAERQRALPGPLKNTPLEPRGDQEGCAAA